ncbi:MAG: SIMPL domain-containing protein [Spirochaetales bacterium]|nr:SIMPL domain-containing protein [Spirochaetales bacterium]
MKKKTLLALLIIAALSTTVQNVYSEGSMEHPVKTVTVKGLGRVSAAPDIVRLNLGVQSFDSNLSSAIADNNSRMAGIMVVLKKYSIPESDYRTSNFSVYYQPPYGAENSQEEGTYHVNNNIFVEFNDIDQIGGFIDEALSAGANMFYGLDYGIKNTENLIKEARKLAVLNAIELADEMAETAGVTTTGIISIEELQYYGGDLIFSADMGARTGSNSITTIPGKKPIEVQVQLVIGIK